MIRKFAPPLFLACCVACVMGAGTITYDKGQPNPNPKGAKGVLEGAGTYTVPAGETLVKVEHYATEPTLKQTTIGTAGTANGKWNNTMGIVAGIYDCEGRITTINQQSQIVYGYTGVVQTVVVK